MELVDTPDLKSVEHYAREGSSPSRPISLGMTLNLSWRAASLGTTLKAPWSGTPSLAIYCVYMALATLAQLDRATVL